MRVSRESEGEVKSLLCRLKEEYKISQRELASWCGVTQRVVVLWYKGEFMPSEEHLDKLREVPLLLAGRNIRYPKQALDILMGRE